MTKRTFWRHAAWLLVGLALLAVATDGRAQGANDRTTLVTIGRPLDSLTSVVFFQIDTVLPSPRLSHQIYIDPIKVFAAYHFNYLHAIGDRFVVGGGPRFGRGIIRRELNVSGYGALLEAQYYFAGMPMRGFLVQATLTIDHVVYAASSGQPSQNLVNPGISFGFRETIGDHVVMGIDAGADYHPSATFGQVTFVSGSSGIEGIAPHARGTVGYAW
jgi:hypothetical protein